MSTNIYTIQKSLDSFLGIKFTPSVPNSAFEKPSKEQLLLEGKVVLDERGKDTGHNQYGKEVSEETRKLLSEVAMGRVPTKSHREKSRQSMLGQKKTPLQCYRNGLAKVKYWYLTPYGSFLSSRAMCEYSPCGFSKETPNNSQRRKTLVGWCARGTNGYSMKNYK